jgi:hypothetical protein
MMVGPCRILSGSLLALWMAAGTLADFPDRLPASGSSPVAQAGEPVPSENNQSDQDRAERTTGGEGAEVFRSAPGSADPEALEDERSSESSYVTETLRGRIVWVAEALQRRFGIQMVPEAAERLLALETPDGHIHPVVEDVRGRAFRRDARLRQLPECELLVRRYHGSPLIQVIRLYAVEGAERYELDYWCEICAITMFELKACDCCQGDIELRRRRAR